MNEMGKLGSLQLKLLIWEEGEVVKAPLLKPVSRPTGSAAGSQWVPVRRSGPPASPVTPEEIVKRRLSFGKRCPVECL